jgi:hypothetical protein
MINAISTVLSEQYSSILNTRVNVDAENEYVRDNTYPLFGKQTVTRRRWFGRDTTTEETVKFWPRVYHIWAHGEHVVVALDPILKTSTSPNGLITTTAHYTHHLEQLVRIIRDIKTSTQRNEQH